MTERTPHLFKPSHHLALVGICLVFALSLLFLLLEEGSAKTIYVDDDGGANYTSIQDAINHASTGDTVFVYEGI
ncbi:MAG TPA: hypothetical protein EYP29_03235, partial [Thermoplasmata archaeon]|nr:hypothetical protein [Thermoplasmata archaeon]